MVYNIQSPDDHPESPTFGAIRDGKWKLIRDPTNGDQYIDQLYNLHEDISEEFDVAEAEAELAAYMGRLFDELSASIVQPRNTPDIDDNSNIDENGYICTGWCEV